MAEDTFAKVIEVEKEIKGIISDERRRVDHWLQSVKKELGGQYRHELKKLKEEVALTRKAKIREAEDEIRETLEKARKRAQQCEEIDDRDLMKLLEKILQQLVPGKSP